MKASKTSSQQRNTTELPRITFRPDDIRLSMGKSDPMMAGVDMDALRPVIRRIEHMKERIELPGTYSVHNEFQLFSERVFDTTDRSTVLWAQHDQFDREGFARGRPLHRDIYYTNPYITCHWCNALNFVDVIAVRRMISLPAGLRDSVEAEPMPLCQCCRKANFFEIGPKIFPNVVEERKNVIVTKVEQELAAAFVLKRAFRSFMRRMYGRAYRAAVRARALLRNSAATVITKNARVRLARRMLKTERYLKIIKEAHPILLQKALLPTRKSSKKLFWYASKHHEVMLYENYVEFCDRTGFDPPRCVVEENIAELAKRIRIRENLLITRVQKRWRGLLTRRIVILFRQEVYWLRQLRSAKILAIQRIYRRHAARLHMATIRNDVRTSREMKSYQAWRRSRSVSQQVDLAKELMRGAYTKERREEITARFTGRVADGGVRGKMRTFAASSYSDDRLQNSMQQVLKDEYAAVDRKKREFAMKTERRTFMMNRIAEYGPRGFGNRGEIPAVDSLCSADALKELEEQQQQQSTKPSLSAVILGSAGSGGTAGPRESSRSTGMRALFNEELRSVTADIVDIISKDTSFDPSSLLGQFKAHNTGKDIHESRKHFKYPKDINVDKLKVLYEEIPRQRQSRKIS